MAIISYLCDRFDVRSRTMYKEPWYKGGNVRPRVPGWCDRILYHSLRDLDTLLTPEKVSVDGKLAHNYDAVNDVLRCSDHSPIHAKFLLRTMWSPEEPTGVGPSIYNIRLFDVIICDQTMSHTLSRYGEWQDTEWDSTMGRMVPIDRGHLAPPAPGESFSERKVRLQVPAPFELDGRVYEEKHFNMEHLLLERKGEMFSFCGLNRGSIRPGAAHHLAIKFDICDADLPDVVSGARPASGECVVRLPLTDFVSSNTLHFREVLICNGLPVTDTGLEEDAETREAVPTKVYADFKIHLVGDGGFHHDMADSFNKGQTDKAHSVRVPSSPAMVRCWPDPTAPSFDVLSPIGIHCTLPGRVVSDIVTSRLRGYDVYFQGPSSVGGSSAALSTHSGASMGAKAPTPPRRSRSNSLERYQERMSQRTHSRSSQVSSAKPLHGFTVTSLSSFHSIGESCGRFPYYRCTVWRTLAGFRFE